MWATERNQNLSFPIPQYSCCLNAAHENSFLPFFSPMVNLSSCVKVDMILTEAGRRKSVLAHEALCLFCGFVSSRREIWSVVSFFAVLLSHLPGLTGEVGAKLGNLCWWKITDTRLWRDKVIQSKQHSSFRHLFSVVETQLGLWTWIWGVYSREIVKSYELAFRKHFWCMSESWQGSALSVYIPSWNCLPCSFYPQDLYKLLTVQLK